MLTRLPSYSARNKRPKQQPDGVVLRLSSQCSAIAALMSRSVPSLCNGLHFPYGAAQWRNIPCFTAASCQVASTSPQPVIPDSVPGCREPHRLAVPLKFLVCDPSPQALHVHVVLGVVCLCTQCPQRNIDSSAVWSHSSPPYLRFRSRHPLPTHSPQANRTAPAPGFRSIMFFPTAPKLRISPSSRLFAQEDGAHQNIVFLDSKKIMPLLFLSVLRLGAVRIGVAAIGALAKGGLTGALALWAFNVTACHGRACGRGTGYRGDNDRPPPSWPRRHFPSQGLPTIAATPSPPYQRPSRSRLADVIEPSCEVPPTRRWLPVHCATKQSPLSQADRAHGGREVLPTARGGVNGQRPLLVTSPCTRCAAA